MPKDTPAQPKDAVGGSDERSDEEAEERLPRRDDEGRWRVRPRDGCHRARARERQVEEAHGEAARRSSSASGSSRRACSRSPAGSTVSFPNFDPIFHNVFSTSPARAFDLGIYKNGESRDVTFAKEGLIRLGCNLHANMAAHVVVVAAPHYVVTDATRRLQVPQPAARQVQAEGVGRRSGRAGHPDRRDQIGREHRERADSPRRVRDTRHGQIRDSSWKGALASRWPQSDCSPRSRFFLLGRKSPRRRAGGRRRSRCG